MFEQLDNHIQQQGYNFKAKDLSLNGEVHELKHENFKGWYIGSVNTTEKGVSYATLTYVDFKVGEKFFVRSDTGKISAKELSAIEESQRQEKKRIEKAKRELQDSVAERALKEYKELEAGRTSEVSGYAKAKKIGDYIKEGSLLGAPVVRDGSIIVPMKDIDGKLWGFQTIDAEGNKVFLDGQKVDDVFFRIGTLNPKEVIYICEGFATGVSIHAATDRTTVVGFSAGKLRKVAEAFRRAYPLLKIVLCGDEDQWKLNPRTGRPYHTGRKAARSAARAVHGSLCQVSFRDFDAEELARIRPTDFNDLHVSRSLGHVKEQIESHTPIAPHEYIATEHTGFHDEILTKSGVKYECRPHDLKDYFERRHPYVVMSESEGVFVYRRGVYRQVVDLELGAFAEKNFVIDDEPSCTNYKAREFIGTVKRANARPMEWFDETTDGFTNFQNGLYHIGTRRFLPHTPHRGFRHQLDFNFDPEAKCPAFETFLEQITCNDPQFIQLLKEYIGYTLSNSKPWAQAALFLIGTGSNGKSTLLTVIQKLIGKENFSTVSLGMLSNDYQAQTLDGKMANISAENEKKGLFESKSFKEMVTGDPSTVRAPYEKPYTMQNRAKFFISMNSMPQVLDESDGFWRRMIPAPFNAVFNDALGNVDRDIDAKLERELPGIYNLCIDAYRTLQERGRFELPSQSLELLGSLRQDNDPVAQFIDEVGLQKWDGTPINGEPTPRPWQFKQDEEPRVLVNELYQDYVQFSETNGFKPFNSVHFGRRAMAVLNRSEGNATVMAKTVSRGGKKLRAWCGVDWRGASEF